MKTYHMPQGSQEWLDIRKGRLTASNFDKILTPTGKLSSQADAYARKLARECVIDDPLPSYPSAAMKWGTQLEPVAREAFSVQTGWIIEEVGFVTHDRYAALGCSPDGLIKSNVWPRDEYDCGLEIKCPSIDTLVDWLLAKWKDADFFPAEYLPQVHGSMVVTGLERWEFCGFFPGVPLFLQAVKWDAYTDKLERALFDFMDRYDVIRAEVLSVLGRGEG